MVTRLQQILATGVVGPGGTVVLSHDLNVRGTRVVPDELAFDDPVFDLVPGTASATSFTVVNTSAAPASCNVRATYFYSTARVFGSSAVVQLTPAPFVIRGAGVTGGGGGSAEGIVVWSVGEAWADVYAAIQAQNGPVICLVERDPSAQRLMTNNGGAPTNLGAVRFMSVTQEILRPQIGVEAGFVLGDGAGTAILNSTGIQWAFDTSLGPVVSGMTNLILNLDDSTIGHTNGVGFQPSQFTGFLSNRAALTGAGGTALISFSASGSTLIMRTSSLLGAQAFASGAGLSFFVDSTADVDPAAFNASTPVKNLTSYAEQVFYDDSVAPPLGAGNVQAAIDALKGGSASADPAFTYVCDGTEDPNGFFLPIPAPHTQPDGDYIPQVTLGGVANFLMIDCPDGAGPPADRQTTQFWVELSAAPQNGDRLDVVIKRRNSGSST